MYVADFISIHAAREGGDCLFCFIVIPLSKFQSTPPVKAATKIEGIVSIQPDISIHAAREGGDQLRN